MIVLNGNVRSRNSKKTLDVAHQDVLDEFDLVWCVKELIVAHSNLVVIWKVWPWMNIIVNFPAVLFLGSPEVVVMVTSCNGILFQLVPKIKLTKSLYLVKSVPSGNMQRLPF